MKQAISERMNYQALIKGRLPAQWTEWFDTSVIEFQPDGTTWLSGEAIDQTALYGIINRLFEMGLDILHLNCKRAAMLPQVTESRDQNVHEQKQTLPPKSNICA